MALQLLRRRFTVEEYHRMAEAGIFSEDDRVELIEGEVVGMTAIGSGHQACVDRLTRLFASVRREQAIVRVQGPIRLGPDSEPQPDLALLRPRADFYAHAHPGPEDVLLVVEVAETSAEYDRTVKLPLYARSGIREVWLVDLATVSAEVCSDPTPGGYQRVRSIRRGERLTLGAFPGLELAADDILG